MERPEHDDERCAAGDECFRCHLRGVRNGLGKPSDFPTRTVIGHSSPSTNNAWERGIAKDSTGRPIVKADGSLMGVKEAGQKRHLIEENRRRNAQVERPW